MKKIKIFSPATVSNVACGFDILGFPIESFGDEMTILKSDNMGAVSYTHLTLPTICSV